MNFKTNLLLVKKKERKEKASFMKTRALDWKNHPIRPFD